MDIKHEDGPDEIVGAFRALSDASADFEQGRSTPIYSSVLYAQAIGTLERWMKREV